MNENELIFHPLPNETMQEYSIRTGLPIYVLDWSYWADREREINDTL